MARSEGLLHSKLPPDARINVRAKATPIGTEDSEQTVPEYVAAGLLQIREALRQIADQAENRSFLVDEYNSAPITGGGTTNSVTVMPTYEYMPEKIESIIIAGPTGAATLQLGDRVWPVTIPASGILVLGPLGLLLGRNDARTLSAGTPGVYFLELMGIADRRFAV